MNLLLAVCRDHLGQRGRHMHLAHTSDRLMHRRRDRLVLSTTTTCCRRASPVRATVAPLVLLSAPKPSLGNIIHCYSSRLLGRKRTALRQQRGRGSHGECGHLVLVPRMRGVVLMSMVPGAAAAASSSCAASNSSSGLLRRTVLATCCMDVPSGGEGCCIAQDDGGKEWCPLHVELMILCKI